MAHSHYYNSVFPLSQDDEVKHADFFWNNVVVTSKNYALADANIGMGHRLTQ